MSSNIYLILFKMILLRHLRTRTISGYRSFIRRNVFNNTNQVTASIANHANGNNRKTEIPSYVWIFFGGFTSTLGIVYFSFLDIVPVTRRTRWIATSPSWERQLGDQEYHSLMEQYRNSILPPTHRASATVNRVGQRIAAASIAFADQHNFSINSESASNIRKPYTYTVVRSEMANAFVLPGNHVFVFTGLFRYVQNEDELAVILGHEMAHNLARHMGEKLSGSVALTLLARLSLLFDSSGVVITLLLPAMSLIRELPNSRTLEIEADRIGILLAAEACYDPRAATEVFAALKRSERRDSAPPEFLSTHPTHDTRMEKFDQWTPQALERYAAINRCDTVRLQMKKARQHAANLAAQRGV
jgi:metalloendopeptidase OMA1, mitochondrial